MSEIEHLEPVLRALSEGHVEVRNDLTDLAERVVRITTALVAADGALAQRVTALEQMPLVTTPKGALRVHEYEPARPGLLSRLFHKR